jgi:predicted CoA-substrate-specific enzyme activase
MSLAMGLDLGSTAVKAVLVEDGSVRWRRLAPTAPGQGRLAGELVEAALAELGLEKGELERIAATGYGRRLFDGASATVDEISANAAGLHRLSGGRCRVIVNLGGQDLKVIRLGPDGRIADFRMNDKCAAGTGRFFEQVARILDTPLESFGPLSLEPDPPADLNSTCVVFAESEIVSLLAGGATRASIIKGFHRSVARRVAGLVGPRASDLGDGAVFLDGGPSLDEGLLEAVGDELLSDVLVLPDPQYTVAYGAAILGG